MCKEQEQHTTHECCRRRQHPGPPTTRRPYRWSIIAYWILAMILAPEQGRGKEQKQKQTPERSTELKCHHTHMHRQTNKE